MKNMTTIMMVTTLYSSGKDFDSLESLRLAIGRIKVSSCPGTEMRLW